MPCLLGAGAARHHPVLWGPWTWGQRGTGAALRPAAGTRTERVPYTRTVILMKSCLSFLWPQEKKMTTNQMV